MPDAQGPGLVLYHADWGRSCRAIWLLRELGVSFTLKVIDWMSIKDPDFMAEVSPLGRIPVLFDGSVHMYESGAMVEFLLGKYGHGKLSPPPGTQQRAAYLQWFHVAETGMIDSVVPLYLHKMMPRRSSKDQLNNGIAGMRRLLQALEDHLNANPEGEWLAGPQLTAADIMLSYTLGLQAFCAPEAPEVLADEAASFPAAAAYWRRMQALPGFCDCYDDINLLPIGEHAITAGESFKGQGTRELTKPFLP